MTEVAICPDPLDDLAAVVVALHSAGAELELRDRLIRIGKGLAAAQALAPGGELEAHLEEAARLLRVCCADPDIMAGWPSLKTWKAADAALRANAGR